MRGVCLVVSLGLVMACGTVALAAPVPTAVFGFEFFDDTLDTRESMRAEQAERLKLVNGEVLALIVASGEMAPVDLAPQAARMADDAPFYKCNGCEVDIARAAGARLEVVGVVRKISNLILSLSLEVREVEGQQKVVRAGQVDIRGNTDESWLRGARYLMKNRIFAPGQPPLAP